MEGEGSNQRTSVVSDTNLIYECMVNVEVAKMEALDLPWLRLFCNGLAEGIHDPLVGAPKTTFLRDWRDTWKTLTEGLLSNPIFDFCRETCLYVVQGYIRTLSYVDLSEEQPECF